MLFLLVAAQWKTAALRGKKSEPNVRHGNRPVPSWRKCTVRHGLNALKVGLYLITSPNALTMHCVGRTSMSSPMKKSLLALVIALALANTTFAQRMYDSNGHQIGRVDGERYYNGSGHQIGRVDGDRIYDGSGRQLGRIEGERIYNASGSQIGRIDGDRLYSASGSQLGRIDGDRIYDGSGHQIGRADGLRRMQVIVYFYFFM